MKYLISILLIATSLMGKAEKYSFEKRTSCTDSSIRKLPNRTQPALLQGWDKKFTVGLSATFLPDTRRPTYINAKNRKELRYHIMGFIMKRYKTTHLSLNS